MEIKLPIYDWVVRFLNGVVAFVLLAVVDQNSLLIILNSHVVKILLSKPELVALTASFAVCYEIGSLFDRVGSVPCESLLKRIRLIPFCDDYVLYNEAKKRYPIITILQKNYAVSRTQFALFATYSIAAAFLKNWMVFVVLMSLVLMQYLSWFKFASKIVKLMNATKEDRQERS